MCVYQGMKVSCTHFQCAAWAFQHLRDSYDSNASPDMNHQLLSFKSYLMLVSAISIIFSIRCSACWMLDSYISILYCAREK